MSVTENQIRDYLWEHKDEWPDIITPAAGLDPVTFADDLSDVTPEAIVHNQIKARLRALDESIREMRLIGKNVTLHKVQDAAVYADLLGRFPDDCGIAVIEMKRPDANTERESFTELLAYGNHIATLFPSVCKADVVYVLVASLNNRIVREAVLHALVFDGKPVFAMIPSLKNDDLSTLRLTPWIPDLGDVRVFARSVFTPRHFSIEKGVWSDESGYWDEGTLNAVASLAAQVMESQGIHGFAYCATDHEEYQSQMPHSLVIGGLNPFEVAHHLYCVNEIGIAPEKTPLAIDTDIPLAALFPGLQPYAEQEREESLLRKQARTWFNHLVRLRRQILTQVLHRSTGKQPQRDRSAFNWRDYSELVLEDRNCRYFNVYPTGILREVYWDVTALDYRTMLRLGLDEIAVHPDPFRFSCEALVDFGKFRRFLHRMRGE